MLFNSLHFLMFFPTVVFIYFAIPHKSRWVLLLTASYYFYMCWKAEYLVLIIASTLIDYFACIQMGKHQSKTKRKPYLILSLLTNLGLLFSFKYFNFFNDSLRAVFTHYNILYDVPTFNVLLPVGISFYTFQTLSYSIEVYRGEKKPEEHLGKFALYVAFFPQLVAGPIERATRLLPQFYKKVDFDYQRVTDGLKLMAWGLFKKLVIADRLAIYVNQVYNNPSDYHGSPLILATYFFAFQIYCDFSGYSDIAIGSAQVLGYDLMQNFRQPYFSKSISEFWKRWHISLSSWFKDYLYIPLGGNQVIKWRWYYNLLITFLVSGLWHGANWTFVVWGALHGFYLIFSIWTKRSRKKISNIIRMDKLPNIQNIIRVLVTFHLVVFAWIFFRVNSLWDALIIIRNMFHIDFSQLGINVVLGWDELFIALTSIMFMEFVHFFQRRRSLREWLSAKPVWFRWGCYYCLVMGIIILTNLNKSTEFIYFQF